MSRYPTTRRSPSRLTEAHIRAAGLTLVSPLPGMAREMSRAIGDAMVRGAT